MDAHYLKDILPPTRRRMCQYTVEQLEGFIQELDSRYPPKKAGRPKKGSDPVERDAEHFRARNLIRNYRRLLKGIMDGEMYIPTLYSELPKKTPV